MKHFPIYITHFCRLTLAVLLLALISGTARAQVSVPFTIENNSEVADEEYFVAIVGEDLASPSNHIWIDPVTGSQLPMSSSYNTVQGPVYGGNQGPGLNGMYADCFKRLSEIPDKTVLVPPIQGCRIYISRGEQLYFYFFGASGAPKGYTAPNHTDPTDPNQGIAYEIIELTNNQYGMFANTTRVDAYQYPIGMELYGADGYFKRVGEVAAHEEIVAAFQASVPVEFQGCLDPETGKITAPSKTPEFADGSVGTMPDPGPYVNYMKPYIDAIWAKYATEDLIFDSGDAGVWQGRVQGEQLVMESISPAFMGRKAIITRRPTTQEAFEGKGVLDNVVQDATTDLLVQAQICAALNRHVIDVSTPNVGLQDWSDASTYYQQSPCNHYAKFWHQQGISLNQLSYGFAYDDVWSYSSSVHTPEPTKVIINLGPYDDTQCTPTTIIPYLSINGAAMEQTSSASLDAGGSVTLSPQPASSGSWNWSGPNNFSATTREVVISNIQATEAGDYTARYNNTEGCESTQTFSVTVNGVGGDCNTVVNDDFSVNIGNDEGATSLTFVPERSGVGAPTCILYYSTSPDGTYPGYLVSPDVPYQINTTAGQTIYYYYTYSLPEGGENNTLNNKQSFVAGECGDDGNTGSHVAIPATIQAEDYTAMSGIQLESTTDTGGGQNVGSIDAADWLEYEISVPVTGTYAVSYRVSSESAGGNITIAENGNSLQTTSFNATGGWQNWTTISTTVNLSAGDQTIRLTANSGGWNINWIEFSTETTSTGCNTNVNADFSVEISNKSSNPSLTFIPERSGVGSSISILYYSTSPDGTYPGYTVSPNTPYQITASSGQTIYYYYTYSLPEGGENNTLNNKKSFVVGQCGSGSSARTGTMEEEVENKGKPAFAQTVLFPNPANDRVTIAGLPEDITEIRIYDTTGRNQMILKYENQQEVSLNISQLVNGLHFVKIQTKNEVVTKSFIKK
ncbi:hypothetical protein C900_01403 [Fulvivirga imtechensis AK7]|uniref:Uncharacterized protein n=1 Tax=Fulvivirga imtechensis AK7 TaxID=1237149 RepID=L8K081_9BACT|nr:beta-1,3-glucanase family protein [Fulvivirga imtechensis]ELR73793.1 hypothetical protein C900_01403 [Fulvivirga imtechensis AK7]